MRPLDLCALFAATSLLAGCIHQPLPAPYGFPAAAADDWGKIQWGQPVDGLQIGLVYWNKGWGKGPPDQNLQVEIYFRNVGKRVIRLMRPEPAIDEPEKLRDPRIGLRATLASGETFTGSVLSTSLAVKPQLLELAPGQVGKATSAFRLPIPEVDHWPAHLATVYPDGGWSPRESASPEARVHFVYRNDRRVRDCVNFGPGPLKLQVADMWTGSAQSGSAYIFFKTDTPYAPERLTIRLPEALTIETAPLP